MTGESKWKQVFNEGRNTKPCSSALSLYKNKKELKYQTQALKINMKTRHMFEFKKDKSLLHVKDNCRENITEAYLKPFTGAMKAKTLTDYLRKISFQKLTK